MSGKQTIPARHGTATLVPKGATIKIINTYGHQVVDTWAFALYPPPGQKAMAADKKKTKQMTKEIAKEAEKDKGKSDKKAEDKKEGKKEDQKEDKKPEEKKEEKKSEDEQSEKKNKSEENSTEKASDGGPAAAETSKAKKTWGSYIPSVPSLRSKAKPAEQPAAPEKPDEAPSKGWSSYIPTGKGFTTYLPSKGTISGFAMSHKPDPEKSYAEQLYAFSKTPVGAAGLSAATGSGYGGTLYAAYSAYNQSLSGDDQPPMEYLSMMHTRASTHHLTPRVNDTLVTNLRAPLLTLIEDTSPGIHDTLIAACDPERYHELGVERWEEHGSCAENLVLALKELNEKNGLQGAKAIGADVTVNAVPAPLNLFMNIPWTDKGDIEFKAPAGKRGDYVRLKAERDCVVVMSACPQDVLEINAKKPMVAHFVVEEAEGGEEKEEDTKKEDSKRPAPVQRKTSEKPGKLERKPSEKPSEKASIKEESKKGESEPETSKKDESEPETSKKDDSKPEISKKDEPTPKTPKKDEPTPKTPKKDESMPETPKKKPKKLERRNGAATPAKSG